MRYFVTLCTALFIISGIALAGAKATIKWDDTNFDFGKIIKNKAVVAKFTFSNPGMIPIIINDVEPSCGCTVADYPKQPIPPGGSGTIEVTYDAKVSGYFSKSIKVRTNTTEEISFLYIKGEVIME